MLILHRMSNRDKDKARTKNKKQAIRLALANIKTNAGCAVCGERFAEALDFHHVTEDDKTNEVPNILSITRCIVEIAKCEIVCATCHRKIHHNCFCLISRRTFDVASLKAIAVTHHRQYIFPSPMPNKKCPRCQTLKPWDHFNSNLSTTDGRQSYCRECDAEHRREYRTVDKQAYRQTEEYKAAKIAKQTNQRDKEAKRAYRQTEQYQLFPKDEANRKQRERQTTDVFRAKRRERRLRQQQRQRHGDVTPLEDKNINRP